MAQNIPVRVRRVLAWAQLPASSAAVHLQHAQVIRTVAEVFAQPIAAEFP
jgi:hypothetical protein